MRLVTNAIFITLAGFALACSGCASSSGERDETAAQGPEHGTVGNVTLTATPQTVRGTKVILATFEFTPAGVTATETLVTFGSANLPRSEANHYRAALVTDAGPALQYGFWDPRKSVVEHQGIVEEARAVYVSRFPFRADAREVRLTDAAGNVVASADIRPAIARFCAERRNDEDCRAVKY